MNTVLGVKKGSDINFYIYRMQNDVPSLKSGNTVLRAAARVSGLMVCALLLGALYYYRERMLFIDAPHVFFRVVNDGSFHIEEHRYGSFITQLFPLVGAKLHLPFKLLLMLYSAGFYLFFLAVILLLVFRYHNYTLAVLFSLYLTIFVSDTFFWPNNEVHQGIGWLMLAFAVNFYVAEKKRPLILTLPLFALLFFLAIWTHPLIMLVAEFLWIFLWLEGTHWPYTKAQSLIFTAILLMITTLKLRAAMAHGYDATRLEVVRAVNGRQFSSLFSSPMFHYFLKGCVRNYWLFSILFLAGMITLIRERKFLLLVWTVGYTAAYILLLCFAFWDVQSGRFYFESEFMPLTIIGCAPFVFFVLPRLTATAAVSLLVAVFLIRGVYIVNASTHFTARINALQQINAKMREKGLTKIVMPGPVMAVDSILIMSWGAPVESFIFSRLNHESPQRTFSFMSPDEIKAVRFVGKDTFLGCWERRGPAQIGRYFRFDTSRPYQVIDYSTLMR